MVFATLIALFQVLLSNCINNKSFDKMLPDASPMCQDSCRIKNSKNHNMELAGILTVLAIIAIFLYLIDGNSSLTSIEKKSIICIDTLRNEHPSFEGEEHVFHFDHAKKTLFAVVSKKGFISFCGSDYPTPKILEAKDITDIEIRMNNSQSN